ncbi:hypothetical protein PSENEW3n2_00005327 [Picochlorum sp. SENEW3]|nr:hypothetical protein PSENEW3n2_00005327 [Picochlorum sp. SENEW3]WPT17322.1 hypothetical protein PSENEW3_00005327 [Picochlorum sp. SENEW3]
MCSIWSPGRLLDAHDAVDAYTPKVGGRAVFPREWDQKSDSISCPSCSKPMSFILSSPLESACLASRKSTATILYVFGCLKEDCGGKKGSWRVLRWTDAMQTEDVVEDSEPSPSQNSSHENDDDAHDEQDADAWGLNLDDEALHSEAFDFGDLQEQLKTVTAGISSSSMKSKKDAQSTVRDMREDRASTQQTSVRKFDGYFPEFFLVQSGTVKDPQQRDPKDSSSDDEQLSTDAVQNTYTNLSDEEEEEGDNVAWEGETYEPDNVICGDGRTAPDGHMLKFIQHMAAIPDQCLRLLYTASRAGSLHLESNKDLREKSGNNCPSCNAPRACVAQVTSPLIAALIESLDMVPATDHFRSPPSSWEWAIIEIRICSKLCTHANDRGKAIPIEEAVNTMGEA